MSSDELKFNADGSSDELLEAPVLSEVDGSEDEAEIPAKAPAKKANGPPRARAKKKAKIPDDDTDRDPPTKWCFDSKSREPEPLNYDIPANNRGYTGP